MRNMVKASLLLLCTQTFSAPGLHYPALNFEYGMAMDYFDCNDEKPVTSDMQQAMYKKIPEFQQFWADNGPELLEQVVAIFGKALEENHQNIHVGLILCQKKGSFSFPFIVNAARYFSSADREAYPLTDFTYTVFHLMLHRFLWQNYPELDVQSSLLQHYKNESPTVRQNLHLQSIIKQVFMNLHKENELQALINDSASYTDPGYSRAWFIINNETGHQAFINELLAYQ
ncbi:hypothetical protein [Legionella sp. CNM-4043-24]|uniref:hypothetical protein n=1 Tax=Legionella sp. CNM-4043-24 TaxID=3421646 RepID=UPI00403A9EF0